MDVVANFPGWDTPYGYVPPDIVDTLKKFGYTVLQEPMRLHNAIRERRPMEFGLWETLYEEAFKKHRLTWKQAEALHLEREAIDKGITPTTYIASELGIHRTSAYRRLKKAKSKHLQTLENYEKTATYDDNLATLYDAHVDINIEPTEIDRIVAGIWLECPWCGTPTRAKYNLCWDCKEKLGSTHEEWERNLSPENFYFLRFKVNDRKREARAEAREIIFREQLASSLT